MSGAIIYVYANASPFSFQDPNGLQFMGGYSTLGEYGEAVWREGVDKVNRFFKPASEYCKSVADRFSEGVSVEASGGRMVAALVGVKQTVGYAGSVSASGSRCLTVSTCVVVGPIVGAYSAAGASVSTGLVTPGSRSWQFGLQGTAVLGKGVSTGPTIASDGAIDWALEGAMGGGLGGAVLICRKQVAANCGGGS